MILGVKKNCQDLCKLSYDTGLENKLFLREECEGVLLTFPGNTKLLWWTLWVSIENKAFVRSIVADQEPGDVFIHGNKATSSCTAAAAEVTTWLNLQQSASSSKIHPSSTSPVESSGDAVRAISPVSFKLQSLQEDDIAGVHSLFSWEASQWFPWPFSTIIVFTLWMRGPMWVGILLTSQCTYPHYTFLYWRNNYRMISGTHWIHCESHRLKLLWDWISTNPYIYWQGHIVVWNFLKSIILNLLVKYLHIRW